MKVYNYEIRQFTYTYFCKETSAKAYKLQLLQLVSRNSTANNADIGV